MASLRVSDIRVGDFTVKDLGSFLREQRLASQLSLRQLADRAGVSNPYLSQVERGLRRPSAEVLSQIARALHISAESLLVRAGMVEDAADRPDVVTAIMADHALDPRQRALLLELYRMFVGQDTSDSTAADDVPAPTDPATTR